MYPFLCHHNDSISTAPSTRDSRGDKYRTRSLSSTLYYPSLVMASSDEPTTYPPDIGCFAEGFWSPAVFEYNNCSVSNNMVNFLNLSGPVLATMKQFVTVYCLNPPAEDICPFGFCPNPDIAGPLVRFSSELTPTFRDFRFRY